MVIVSGGLRTNPVAVIVPAKNEAARVAETVRAAGDLPNVAVVIVVDDGSDDGTGDIARDAGAVVSRHDRSLGKAAAMDTGASVASLLDQYDRLSNPRHLLFLDGDLGRTAANAGPLMTPVLEGAADMVIATIPPAKSPGGHGFVVRLARRGILRNTGWTAAQPLSGQRCMTRECFEKVRPLAPGFGVETGLTIDALTQGLRVMEVEVELTHNVTGRDWRSVLHRGKQYRDVMRALAARRGRSLRAEPLDT